MRNDELEAALATLTQDRSKMEGDADSDSESCISTDQDGDFGSSRVGTFDFGDFPLGEGILPRCSNLGSPLDFQSPYSSRRQSRESSKQSTTREGKMGSSQEAMRKEESLGSSKELIKKAGSWIKEERGPIAHNVLPIRETSPSHSGKEANPPKTPPKNKKPRMTSGTDQVNWPVPAPVKLPLMVMLTVATMISTALPRSGSSNKA